MSVAHHGLQPLLDLRLGERSTLAVASSRIRMAGSLSRTPRQRGELPLPHREVGPAFAHVGVEPVRQIGQPIADRDALGRCTPRHRSRRADRSGCFPARCRRRGTAPAAPGRSVGDNRPGPGCGYRAVHHQFTLLELVEAADQLGDAALARAGVTDQRHRLIRPDRQREVGQHDLARTDSADRDAATSRSAPVGM